MLHCVIGVDIETVKTAYDYLQSKSKILQDNLNSSDMPNEDLKKFTAVCFFSDDILFASDINGVAAIISPEKIVGVPGVKNEVYGMLSWNEKAIPIIDLKQIFWGQIGQVQKKSKIIVYKFNESYWGILLCSVEGLRKFDRKNIEPIELDQSVSYSRFVRQIVFQDESRCAILNIDELIKWIAEDLDSE